MESTSLTDQHSLEPASVATPRPVRSGTLPRDLAGVTCLAVASLLAGLAINYFRAAPLPLDYQTPEQRLAGLSAEQIRKYLDQLTSHDPAKPQKARRKK